MNGSGLPASVEELHRAFMRLDGVTFVDSGIDSIAGIRAADLDNFARRTLPHGALGRTDGAIGNEALIWVELELSRDDSGWRALEFIAWWVRDQARGAVPIQITPFGLPPVAGGHVQLGNSLRFCIHIFRAEAGESAESHLQVLSELRDALVESSDLYHSMLHEAGGQGILRPSGYAPNHSLQRTRP